jgi:hypothetical protein
MDVRKWGYEDMKWGIQKWMNLGYILGMCDDEDEFPTSVECELLRACLT